MRRLGCNAFVAGLFLLVLLGCAASELRAVRKAEELDQAIQQGVKHIVIVEHLDLTGYPSRPAANGERVLFAPPGTVKSITVRGTQT
jgi:hypothetical protein